jgi:hypothetical protein
MQSENVYYEARTKVETRSDKGKLKYRKDLYIIKAISPTEVEKILNEQLKGYDFEIENIKLTKILDILG